MQLLRVVKQERVLDKHYTLKEIGFNLHDTMIYEKTGWLTQIQQGIIKYLNTCSCLVKVNPKLLICSLIEKNKWGGQYTFGNTSNRQVDGTLISKGKRKIKEYGVRFNIWRINGGKSYSTKDEIAYKHPAIFP